MISWGLQFAHQVGRLILAHVTNQDYPIWDPLWVWVFVVAVDSNSLKLLGREPQFQKHIEQVRTTVYITLLASFLLYWRFVGQVIRDITNHMGIACFTVRKKDERGNWVDAKVIDKKQK